MNADEHRCRAVNGCTEADKKKNTKPAAQKQLGGPAVLLTGMKKGPHHCQLYLLHLHHLPPSPAISLSGIRKHLYAWLHVSICPVPTVLSVACLCLLLLRGRPGWGGMRGGGGYGGETNYPAATTVAPAGTSLIKALRREENKPGKPRLFVRAQLDGKPSVPPATHANL